MITRKHSSPIAATIMVLASIAFQCTAIAAETAPISPTGSIFKMLMGLAVVLAVMALITWLLKRMLPGANGQQSVIRVVGGVSVGSRERVVVVEVADRWLVVGVAPGQVNSIANLEAGDEQTLQLMAASGAHPVNSGLPAFTQPMVNSFAGWLQKSSAKFKNKPRE